MKRIVLPVRWVFYQVCVLFLAFCEYRVKNWDIADNLVIAYMLVLFAEIVYVEFPHGIHVFPFVCDVYYAHRIFLIEYKHRLSFVI